MVAARAARLNRHLLSSFEEKEEKEEKVLCRRRRRCKVQFKV